MNAGNVLGALVCRTAIPVTLFGDGGLAGWWRFSETSGDIAIDSSGNGRDAIIDTNRVERIQEAPGGGALWFDGMTNTTSGGGATASVSVPDFAEIRLSNTFSVAAWVYMEEVPPLAPLVVRSSGDGLGKGFGLYVGEGGGIGAYVREKTDANMAKGGHLMEGAWNHVAMTYSGDTLTLYLDGETVASRKFASAASADASVALSVGSCGGDAESSPFAGAIADVRVWDSALTATQMRSVYAQFLGEALSPNADDDGDGMPNGWEILHRLNPRDPSDAELDADGDGVSNLQEYRLGRNPHAGATFAIPSLIKNGTVVGP